MTKSLRAQANAALHAARAGALAEEADTGQPVPRVTVLTLSFDVTEEMKKEIERAKGATRRALELPG